MARRYGVTAACLAAVALVMLSATGKADARGVGGGGFAGVRGGGGVSVGHGWGGRPTAIRGGFGHRQPHGLRHVHRHGGHGHHHHRVGPRGRFGGAYGDLPYAYGGYGSGGYDPGPSRNVSPPNIGIPPSPVLPPAIYVIGDKAGRQGGVVRKGSGGVVADSREAAGGSSVVVTRRAPDRRHRAR